MAKRTWKEMYLNYLETFYGSDAELWKEEHDDRRFFSNMYYHLREAILSLEDEPQLAVKVAMNRYIDDEVKVLEEIQCRFKERIRYRR